MTKVISFNNHKGGTGRSSNVAHLSEILSSQDYKILVIDMDSQGNVSEVLKADKSGATVADVLLGNVPIRAAIQSIDGIDVLPSNLGLAITEQQLKQDGKEFLLKNVLDPIKSDYDLVFIDNSPSIGTLAFNSIIAADYVVLSVQADLFSFQGVENLKDSIDLVKEIINPDLEILGIIINRYEERTNFSKQIGAYAEQFAQSLDTELFPTKIRECIRIKEAQLLKQPLMKIARGSNAAKDYPALAKEFIERINQK